MSSLLLFAATPPSPCPAATSKIVVQSDAEHHGPGGFPPPSQARSGRLCTYVLLYQVRYTTSYLRSDTASSKGVNSGVQPNDRLIRSLDRSNNAAHKTRRSVAQCPRPARGPGSGALPEVVVPMLHAGFTEPTVSRCVARTVVSAVCSVTHQNTRSRICCQCSQTTARNRPEINSTSYY